MRLALVIAAAAALFASAPAQAGLVGSTVDASFWIPVFGLETTSPPPAICTGSLPCEIPDYSGPGGPTNSPPPTVPVDFLEGATSGSTISVGDTQIVITNELPTIPPMPFCSTALPCSDPFVGFQFVFTGAADIKGVSVDPASDADFLPNDTAPHAGLQLLSPTRIVVDVTGDLPALGDKLILDVSFSSVVPPPVPEPSTWALMLLGFSGLGFAGWRRKTAQTA